MADQVFGEVRFEELETMYVASSTRVSHSPEDDVIDFMTRWGEENGIDPNARKFGFDMPVTEEEQAQGLRGYEYWIQVPQDTAAADGVVVRQVAGCRYAVLRIAEPFVDPFARIPQGWRRLANWVTEHGYGYVCYDHRYCLEEVIEENGTTYMDIYLPVR